MAISESDIGDSFRVSWTGQIFELTDWSIHFYLTHTSITLMINYKWTSSLRVHPPLKWILCLCQMRGGHEIQHTPHLIVPGEQYSWHEIWGLKTVAVRIHYFCDVTQCHWLSGFCHFKGFQCLCMAKNTHLVTASYHRPESSILNVVFTVQLQVLCMDVSEKGNIINISELE